jgi:ribosomal protein S18 acetylase RimI-like enzyme
MNTTIRAANINDMEEVFNLVKELAIYEKAEQEVTTNAKTYRKDFEEGLFEVLLATIDDKIVGMMLYYNTYSTWKGKMIYLEDFIIKEAYRKQGIGQQLYDYFIEVVKLKDASLAKWQVLNWNTPAINFYEKNNAEIEQNWWNVKVFTK